MEKTIVAYLKVVSWHSLGGTEEIHEIYQWGQPFSMLSYEPSSFNYEAGMIKLA
jgi:hypothetical protein